MAAMISEPLLKEAVKEFLNSDSWKQYEEQAKAIPFVREQNVPVQYYNFTGRPMAIAYKLSDDFKQVLVSQYILERRVYRPLATYDLKDFVEPKKKPVAKKAVKGAKEEKPKATKSAKKPAAKKTTTKKATKKTTKKADK